MYGDLDPDGFYYGAIGRRYGLVPSNMVYEIAKDEVVPERRRSSEVVYGGGTNNSSLHPSADPLMHRRARWGSLKSRSYDNAADYPLPSNSIVSHPHQHQQYRNARQPQRFPLAASFNANSRVNEMGGYSASGRATILSEGGHGRGKDEGGYPSLRPDDYSQTRGVGPSDGYSTLGKGAAGPSDGYHHRPSNARGPLPLPPDGGGSPIHHDQQQHRRDRSMPLPSSARYYKTSSSNEPQQSSSSGMAYSNLARNAAASGSLPRAHQHYYNDYPPSQPAQSQPGVAPIGGYDYPPLQQQQQHSARRASFDRNGGGNPSDAYEERSAESTSRKPPVGYRGAVADQYQQPDYGGEASDYGGSGTGPGRGPGYAPSASTRGGGGFENGDSKSNYNNSNYSSSNNPNMAYHQGGGDPRAIYNKTGQLQPPRLVICRLRSRNIF